MVKSTNSCFNNSGLFGRPDEDGKVVMLKPTKLKGPDKLWLNLINRTVCVDPDHLFDDVDSSYVYHYNPKDEGHTCICFDEIGIFVGVIECNDYPCQQLDTAPTGEV